MRKNLAVLFLLAACFATPAFSEDAASSGDPLAGTGPFSDPAFLDCMETADGYLNSKNTMEVRSDFREFRDSVISAPPPSLKALAPNFGPGTGKSAGARVLPEERAGLPALPAGHYKVTFAGDSGPVGSFVWPLDSGSKKYAREYVLLGVSVGGGSYDKLLVKLEAAGLRFAGEKIAYGKKTKQMVILGWAPYASIAEISKISGVGGVVVEKKSIGVPLKTRVRFTLKVPYQNKPNAFVPEFIKRLTEEGGFDAEAWFRLPQKNSESKFSVFDVTGTLPVGMIGELSRSPFVASVEFKD
ncbi:MAG: hypothetical protein Q7R35_09880, partial [Elusimicrobiota bacterium]|nr:hypothetical protein [Elusimicrobiota bacterium]